MKWQRVFKISSSVILLAITTSVTYSQSGIYNVKKIIEENGKTILITKELQELIDQCSAAGGGTIYFPAGDYLTGSLVLGDNIYLEISAGATLYGSMDINDYTEKGGKSLIYAKGASNLGIIGQGTINGNGDFFWRGKDRPYIRPERFMLFVECQHIKINGISMINTPNWNLELLNCDFAWIDGVTMISDIDSPNSDGIDPTSSSNIFISNCYFELGDDAICPKSRGTKPTENMVVENCIIRSDDSAIKLGTRSEAPIRNLLFNNIIIRDTQYGIGFFAKDGGTFENIRFSNITIESSLNESFKDDKPSGSYPIFLDIERRKPDSPISAIKDIYFSDITIISKDGHCLFLGQPDQRIENLHFSNVNFNLKTHRTLEGSKKPRGVRSLVDRAANDYSHIPANFTFAYINGISFDDLTITDYDNSEKYERHMIWGYDVHEFAISGFKNKLVVENRELPLLHFKESSSIQITSCSPSGLTSPFVYLEGNSTKDVIIQNNNLFKVRQIIQYEDNVDENEITEFNNLMNDTE